MDTPDVKYLWHFTNHRVHWDQIKEPSGEFNKTHNINTHNDLVKYCINRYVTDSKIRDYCLELLNNKTKWSGCFGCLTIINHNFIKKMDTLTKINDIMMNMDTNRKRRVVESIFPMICQYMLNKEIHTSFDGLYYDGKNGGHGLISEHIEKKSFNRK